MTMLLLLAFAACKAEDPASVVPPVPPTPDPPALSCGDRLIDTTEACDDGVNDGSYGGCLSDCSGLAPHCGDGVLDGGEVCDNGDNYGQYGGCLPGCADLAPFCGDGVVDFGEACDDATNDGAYEGCESGCLALAGQCGDGVVTGPEACDDGVNDGSYNTCDAGCSSLASFCGDGTIDAVEACDDGANDGQYAGCLPGCEAVAPFCGDANVDPSEVCDDGLNIGQYEGCNAGCQSAAGVCGDGIHQPEEVCDDGVNDFLDGGCRPGCEEEDLSVQVYDPDRVLDIDLVVDAVEFEALRRQFRDTFQMFEGEDCHSRPTGTFSPYQWIEAEATIDGQAMGTVGMRKKGGFGSVRYTKPALKIDFDRYTDDLNFESIEHMSLNNNLNDVSLVRQCLAYAAFRQAGLPAARCNFATVSVNGEDLGLYVNVEPMKKDMIRYHFGSETGNLYEGWISDFNDKFFGTYDQDLNADVDDSLSDMRAVLDAMDSEDVDLEAALEPHLDVDHFYRFWAMEVLTWQHDGYTANSNNHYLYNDPARGDKLVFLPWGMDHGMHDNDNATFPATGRLQGAIPQRLWNHPPAQARFLDTLRDVSENAWDSDALLELLERYHQVVLSSTPPADHPEILAETEVVREYIRNRPQQIADLLLEPPADIPLQPRLSRCMVPVGVAQLAITDSTWSANGLGSFEDCDAAGALALTVNAEAIQGDGLTCRSGIHDANARHYFQQRYTGGNLRYTTSFLFPPDGDFFLASGVYTEPIQWSASITVRDLALAENVRRLRIDPITVVLEDYDQVEGAPVSMMLDGMLWEDVEY